MTANSRCAAPSPVGLLRSRTAGVTFVLVLGVLFAGPAGAHAARAPVDSPAAAATVIPGSPAPPSPSPVSASVTTARPSPAPTARPRDGGHVRQIRHRHRDRLDCMERWYTKCERRASRR
ncbi:hypothetical protein [Streptosporangium sp. NPDC004631]